MKLHSNDSNQEIGSTWIKSMTQGRNGKQQTQESNQIYVVTFYFYILGLLLIVQLLSSK